MKRQNQNVLLGDEIRIARIASQILLSVLVLVVFLTGCSHKEDAKSTLAGKAQGRNVLFITLDTTRADHIGCYGYADAETPTLDGLAAKGVLFEKAFSQVPLTLSAHTTMLTGRYPREHGIRDNGRNALSDKFPTLATIFKEHGYATGAFVASFVLDKRFGLQRGFDAYFDDMGEVSFDKQPLEWQIPGRTVTDRALTWLETVKDRRFFAWFHYYDAHDPHIAPDGFAKEGRKPYDSEITCLDAQVKQLTDWLANKGLTERTLVVIVGDHGESFKEHDEAGHTTFLFDTNLRVPLLFYGPGLVAPGKKSSATVGQIDIFPTLLELFGWPVPSGILSRSLARALEGQSIQDEENYSESLYALLSFNWAEQRSLVTPEWKYISSTKPQLYDRRKDPDEKNNVLAANPSVGNRLAKDLRKKYDSMIPGRAEIVAMDEKALRAVKTLGYIGGGSSVQSEQFCTQGLPDPRDMIKVVEQFHAGLAGLDEAKTPGDIRDLLPLLVHVVEQSPASVYFQQTIGHAYLRGEDPARAFEHLNMALKTDPFNAPVMADAAMALSALGRLDEAEQHFKTAFELQDSNAVAHAQYGELLMKQGRLAEAEAQFRKAIEAFPTFASAHAKLGDLLRRLGRTDEALHETNDAIKAFNEAKQARPDLATTNIQLGLLYVESNQPQNAISEFREAVRKTPDSGEANWNLGKSLLAVNDLEAAGETMRRLAEIHGFEAEASYGMGVVAFKRGNVADTVRLYEQAAQQKPNFVQAIQELAQYYIGAGRARDAIRVLNAGLEHSPNFARFAHMLAHVYATASDATLRNGPKAIALAEEAAKATNYQEPFVLQTLAEAYAEAGQFDKAIETAESAKDLAQRLGRTTLVKSLEEQVEGYRVGRAYRDPRL
ncbi:MAG: sulfatase-like hydrolase/transferase [Planctomycetes bacterium]|nr:sulfatase-like hydrolase/transferase [Planctomycetota bacterium]MBI3834356.1 sulfatase-like hydrolase/transferase [Planctomycetota bacterium]